MFRYLAFTAFILMAIWGIFLAPEIINASPAIETASPLIPGVTPTFDTSLPEPPATVYPPSQADNGEQTYWSMCVDCHGDRGQGLNEAWRSSYSAEFQDCWKSGCHSLDYPENSFEIPQTGVPAISGSDSLSRFSDTFKLQSYILENMPLSPSGSITSEQSFSLAAFIRRLNGRQIAGLTLTASNSSAIPIHHVVNIPENEFAGVLILSGFLILAAIGLNRRTKRYPAGVEETISKPNFFHHLHPPRIPTIQSNFRYTLGSGGLAIFLSMILLITGMLEMYYYIPDPDQAAISIEILTTLVPYGNLIRNLHYWSAQALVVVITIHLLRVVLTGAYAPPRGFNFLLGLGLLVLILLLDFTGYVLRWDEGIRWALVVGTNLLKSIPWIGEGLYEFVIGGSEPNAATVTRFYGWHVFGLTFIAGILIVWHAFRVRRDGGIAAPPPVKSREKQQITRFELVRREVLAMIIAGIGLMIFSLAVMAPIDQPLSDTGTMTSDSQAPWFFLWIQQLLRLGDPFVWGVLTPVLVIVILGLLPYVLPNARKEELGRWLPVGNRIAQVLTTLIILVILALTLWGAIAN